MKQWTVYILRCVDDSLYTGITVDLKKRLEKHRQGLASKYTRSRLPVELVWSQKGFTESQAKKREYEIKTFSRAQKELLVSQS